MTDPTADCQPGRLRALRNSLATAENNEPAYFGHMRFSDANTPTRVFVWECRHPETGRLYLIGQALAFPLPRAFSGYCDPEMPQPANLPADYHTLRPGPLQFILVEKQERTPGRFHGYFNRGDGTAQRLSLHVDRLEDGSPCFLNGTLEPCPAVEMRFFRLRQAAYELSGADADDEEEAPRQRRRSR